ncbi:unnamed protein product [Urochloa humidicola]
MVLSLVVFCLGAKTHRFYPMNTDWNLFGQASKPLAPWLRGCLASWRSRSPDDSHCYLTSSSSKGNASNTDSIEFTPEATALLKLFPIWATCLFCCCYHTVLYFTKQLKHPDTLRFRAKLTCLNHDLPADL